MINVFVPSFNHSSFIEQTLRSIFHQTLPPKKLLVIDDGSSDDSPKVIEKVLKDCPFEHYFIKRENRGLTKTLNEALSMLEDAEFFAYIGSDDIWFPEFLQKRIN
ncbi:MAG: glycosyltransferase family 2 protein, partial [Ignavibacterium sp.]|nr:glycosyltransferase family 2 protein [Ignavibacterium sp.]MDW8376068.1 glycosyltransferase family A protein [Ignavibacteriales bacterium]